MRRFIIFIGTLLALVSCKPEVYTGPLDSPVGNWDGVKTDYYFTGKMVGQEEGCEYSAISFYKDMLCCIEGVKGTFPYSYDNSTGLLIIDNKVWAVHTMTGAELVIEYLETIFPEVEQTTSKADDSEEPAEPNEPVVEPDKNGLILPIEYDGVTINADENGYYYESGHERIYCNFFGSKDESGSTVIDFWYDRHIDYFIPLVVETKK